MLALAPLLAPQTGTVVMIHGAGGGGWEYKFWKPLWERTGWRVIARDLVPASGGLAKTIFTDYTAQVSKWTKGAKRPLVVVGASLGGALALATAASLKPDALILVNAAGTEPNVHRDPIPPVVQWANGPLKDTEVSMPDSDRATITYAWKRWRDESGAVMRIVRAGVAFGRPSGRSLVIISEKDTDVEPAKSERLALKLGADVHRYAGMSHVGPLLSRRATQVAEAAQIWVRRRKS